MKERYEFRYNEVRLQNLWKNCVFLTDNQDNPLFLDIYSRLTGVEFSPAPTSDLLKIGILSTNTTDEFQKASDFANNYGSDAVRLALLLEKTPLCHEKLVAHWRYINELFEYFYHSAPTDISNISINLPKLKNLILKKDLNNLLIYLKSLKKNDQNKDLLFYLFYPFVPHLITTLMPDIHQKMPLLYQKIITSDNPEEFFVLINQKMKGCFFPSDVSDLDKIKKEALSFAVKSAKIKPTDVKNIIIIPHKGANIVI